MINRRSVVAGFAALGSLPVHLALAAPGTAFSDAAFTAAQKAGKSILLVVHAPWCPTCRAQEPILKKLLAEKKYSGIVVFSIDFDSQKDLLRRFNAPKQSILIGFKGTKETKRSAGDTEAMTIEDLLETTL
ncbi:MAG: thioredoxin family protein [Proteobacteria bacterium]|nr:thioredoxin family protein [Pseudomonadota bacterium]